MPSQIVGDHREGVAWLRMGWKYLLDVGWGGGEVPGVKSAVLEKRTAKFLMYLGHWVGLTHC